MKDPDNGLDSRCMQSIMILTLIALAIAAGFNYTCLVDLQRAYTHYSSNYPLLRPSVAAGLWQVATTTAVYIPLWCMGLQGFLTFLPAWTLNCMCWQSNLLQLRDSVARYSTRLATAAYIAVPVVTFAAAWYTFYTLATAVHSNFMIAVQIVVGALALAVSASITLGLHPSMERPWSWLVLHTMFFIVAAMSLGRVFMWVAERIIEEPVWMSINLACGVAAHELVKRRPQLVPQDVNTEVRRALFEIAMGLALYYLISAFWTWPTETTLVALAVSYATIAVRGGPLWSDPTVPIAVKVAAFLAVYSLMQLAVVAVMRYPLLLAPVPFIWAYTLTESPETNTAPTLQQLQTAYDHHFDSLTLTSLSPRCRLEGTVQVPAGEEATWHRYAANYYREVLQNQYFLEVPEVMTPVIASHAVNAVSSIVVAEIVETPGHDARMTHICAEIRAGALLRPVRKSREYLMWERADKAMVYNFRRSELNIS